MMSKIITAVMLALAMALANVAIGAGTGMPMMKGLKDPTVLADLVDRALKLDPTGNSLLDSARCKKDGSCATAHDYFYGIHVEHPKSQLGDIAELPRYLRSLVKQPAPTGEWYMSRLLVKGEKRKYDHMAWHRAFFKGEDVWDDPNTGEHILAGFCENVVGKLKSPVAEKETPIKIRDVTPPVPQVTVPPVTTVTSACPNGYLLVANAWSPVAMPEDLRKKAEKLVDSAEARDTKNASDVEAYKPDALSRTLGGQLRRVVKTRANVNANITVNLRDPKTFKVIGTLGVMDMVEGIGKMSLTYEQHQMVVETIWPNGFVSPAVSGGERRLELFPYEWGNNCTMNVHGLVNNNVVSGEFNSPDVRLSLLLWERWGITR